MRKTIIEFVKEHAVNFPYRDAIITPACCVTYGELFELVKGYAGYLDGCGVKKSDIVVVKSSQSVDYIVTDLALHLIGALPTTLERSVSKDKIIEVAGKLNAAAIICDDETVADSFSCVYADTRTVMRDAKKLPFEDCTFPDLSDLADILYTTGTTGSSKGVQMTHENLVALAENVIHGCEYREDFMLIVPGAVNHANPIRNIYASLVNGNSIYILNGMMNIKAFFDAIEYPCKKVACVLPPSMIRILLQLSGGEIAKYADRIDFIVSSTSPFPESDKERMSSLLPHSRLYNSYGSSESGVSTIYNYNMYPGLKNCVGKATVNSEILIVDDEKNEISSSAEHPGLIASKGSMNMIGYVNEPEMTAQYLRNGVFYTNDIGYKDENGFVFILGRAGDVINVGGMKVAPSEVEEAAIAYDGIEDCICVAVEDKTTGKALKLLVVLPEGADLNQKELRQFLADRLESYKVPQYYEQVDQVRHTYNGKLDRKAYQ